MTLPRRRIGLRGVTAALILTGCSDLTLQPDRIPSGVEFEEALVTVTEGEEVLLSPHVVDQDGRRFDRVPAWTEIDWRSSDENILLATRADLSAQAPGEVRAHASIAGLSGSATVRVNPSTLDVEIPRAYLVQSVQRPDGSVPLVAGRDATLRLFAVGDVINFFEPDAEVTIYSGDEEIGRKRLSLTHGGAVPTEIDEGVFRSSWSVTVPGAMVEPGLSFSIELDPDGIVPLADVSSARFPAEGAQPVDVRSVPDLELRFVPVHQTRFGSTGQITSSSASSWAGFLIDVFPIAGIELDVRSTFHTDAVTDDGETDWSRIIQEIWALRVLDDDDRYYYGVLERHGGWAGLGYVGWPVSIGWDDLRTVRPDPVPLAYSTFAHELGHNFGRRHAPACDAGNPDPRFPHADGRAGVYGLQQSEERITRPGEADLMGYCRPRWVSDYTYEAVLDFRIHDEEWRRGYHLQGDDAPGLLVWGSVIDGEITLEPGITLDRVDRQTGDDGHLVIQGLDESGAVLFRAGAERMELAHGPAGSFSFSSAIPLSSRDLERLATIRVEGAGVPPAEHRAALATDPAGKGPPFAVVSAEGGRSEAVWDAERYPLLVVRAGETGEVIAFARNGRFALPESAERLRFDLSDGVRSMRARAEVR